jgi:hypothetical protein
VGLIAEEEAEAWRARLLASGEERPAAPSTTREAGEDQLRELFASVAPDTAAGVELGRCLLRNPYRPSAETMPCQEPGDHRPLAIRLTKRSGSLHHQPASQTPSRPSSRHIR